MPLPINNHIRFDALEVGQTAQYIGLNGSAYFFENMSFEYSDDTLRLEIVDKDAKGYKVAESLHYVGYVHPWLNVWRDNVFYYYLLVSNDTLRVSPVNSGEYLYSRIFAHQISQTGLPLAKITSPEVEILGWKTSFPKCECRQQGFAENYNLFGQTYSQLNVIVENTAMAWDWNGETYVFAKPHGIVRFSTYTPWTGEGYGWDLLPN